MDQFKLDLYEDEVFVFTPKGDLFKLGKGSTVLDFAFHIHSKLGCKCIGAKVNGRNAQLKQILNSGDQVEIMTSNTQTPKQLAEHRHNFQSTHQDTAGTQGNGCPPACICQRNTGTQIQEPENRI